MKKLSSEQENLQKLFQKKKNIINQWQQKSSTTVKISEVRNLYNNLELMEGMIEKQLNIVEERKREVEDRRKELLEASKQKKVFEKLKEKDYEEFKYNLLKKEEAFIDEIVSNKFVNR